MNRTWRVKLRILKMSAWYLWWDIRHSREYVTPEEAELLPALPPIRRSSVKAGDIIDIQMFPGGSIKRYHVV